MAPETKMVSDQLEVHRQAAIRSLRSLIESSQRALNNLESRLFIPDSSFLQHVPDLARRMGEFNASHHALELMTIMEARINGGTDNG